MGMVRSSLSRIVISLFVAATISAVSVTSAYADTLLVNDGNDTDSFTDPFGGNIFTGTSNPAPQFSTPGFFGGALGSTDTPSADISVAHRFTGVTAGDFVPFIILTIGINEDFAGSANDRILAGDASAGATAGSALVNLNGFAVRSGNTITVNLIDAGLLSTIQSNGFLDVLLTDDRNIDFIALSTNGILGPEVPIPAALPLMVTALVGAVAARRRRPNRPANSKHQSS